MAKRIVAEKAKAGLRHAVVCPNVTGRTKERCCGVSNDGSFILSYAGGVGTSTVLWAFLGD